MKQRHEHIRKALCKTYIQNAQKLLRKKDGIAKIYRGINRNTGNLETIIHDRAIAA